MGHCSRECYHDEEINSQIFVELGEHTADFERIFTLIENKLGIDSSVSYHGIYIQRVPQDRTSWNKLQKSKFVLLVSFDHFSIKPINIFIGVDTLNGDVG